MEDMKPNYYAVIPGYVRYDKRLSPAEKLLYGEITALSNKNGYCFASNKYFSNLYSVTNRSVTGWLANLELCGYIQMETMKNEDVKVFERRIYITDTPLEKNFYTPRKNFLPPMEKNFYYNNTSNNNTDNKMIDDLFILILNKDNEISEEFYEILEKIDFVYEKDWLDTFEDKNKLLVKTITITLYQIYNSEFDFLLTKFSRETLINLYLFCIEQSKTTEIQDFMQYYKKTIINKYTNDRSI